MAEINKKVLSEILQKNYELIPENITRVRRKPDRQVWRITNNNKEVYALKFLEKRERALIIAAANDYMHRKGISVANVLPALDGKPFINLDNGCILLFKWLDGEHPSYEHPGMIERMAALLANFHEASEGYAAAGNPISVQRLDWNRIYKKKIKKLARFREKAASSMDPFSQLFLSHLPWLTARTKWVLAELPHTALSTLLANLQLDPRLGHGDYSHLNVLCRNNELTVIDLDTVGLALPMRDISHLSTCINHELGAWSRERFQSVVDAYGQIRPLSAEEHELLLIDLIFPHKAIRLAEKYFDNTGNPALIHEFERSITIDREKITDLGLGPI
ncbi:CotS family spore coat protein [Paenibacillus sp. sptzw28]|uniref:CotS family spore coat protein n=1 Tax=Paenibacillus sp. sptzw28 TaxID=715179 RepID=UPI001C6E568B|nr:CotS family spore coat protein [Paenibacillus sp. sptzw28]QYR22813.1 CotS family spore coat protein [Paenibacillus sp. sptzw28]